MKEYVTVKYWFDPPQANKADGSKDIRYINSSKGWKYAIFEINEAYHVVENKILNQAEIC